MLAPFIAISLAVIFQIILVVILIVPKALAGEDANTLTAKLTEQLASSPVFIGLLMCGQLGFAITAIGMACLSPVPFRERLNLKAPRGGIRICLLGALATIPILAAVGPLASMLPGDATTGVFLEQLGLIDGIIFVILVALAPGFIEEFLFRGYLQSRLLKRWKPFTAIAVSSLIFGLVHLMPNAIAVALPLGIWIGILAWRTGSIIPGIVAHAFINGALNLWRMIVKFAEPGETTQSIVMITSVVIGSIALVLAGMWMIRQKEDHLPENGLSI